jgi:hypothetical protein
VSSVSITRMKRWVLLIATLLLVGACSPAPENLAVVANGPGTVGVGPTQRLLFGVRSPDGDALASPDIQMELQLHFRDPTTENDEFVLSTPTRFEWLLDGVLGIYVADVAFARPGVWVATLIAGDGTATVPSPFGVDPQASVPEVGEPAISVSSRTATGISDLSLITTDPDPDPDLYALSLDKALANGKPTVVAFATPAFCTSATCGPVVDTLKAFKDSFPDDANWLHIEIYKNIDVDDFADLELDDAVAAWAFPTEPWVYVMDGDGVIVARFEGFVTPQELGAALEAASQ